MKILREEEKREKEEDVAQLEETVITLRQQNEKERLALLEFEDVLRKHKQRVEKQRRWAETQSSYRLCLERMIRDTMHQYALSLPQQYIYIFKWSSVASSTVWNCYVHYCLQWLWCPLCSLYSS